MGADAGAEPVHVMARAIADRLEMRFLTSAEWSGDTPIAGVSAPVLIDETPVAVLGVCYQPGTEPSRSDVRELLKATTLLSSALAGIGS
jgi:hypothetical protein